MANGTLTYGDVTVDSGAIPEASRHALMQYGLSHFLGNVQASKLVARIKGKEGLGHDKADREAVKAWREANSDKIAQWTKEHLDSALNDLTSGTIGTHSSGPRIDPVERKFNTLVEQHVRAQLKGVGKKLPKTDDELVDFGNGQTRTRSQMLANVKSGPHGERLRKEAERMVKEETRLAKRAEDSAAQAGSDPSALGL